MKNYLFSVYLVDPDKTGHLIGNRPLKERAHKFAWETLQDPGSPERAEFPRSTRIEVYEGSRGDGGRLLAHASLQDPQLTYVS